MNRNIPESTEYTRLAIAVHQFAKRMENKLTKKMEVKSGWDDPDWPIEDIKRQLIEHVEKGDFVDVANFAMFAWFKGLRTPSTKQSEQGE